MCTVVLLYDVVKYCSGIRAMHASHTYTSNALHDQITANDILGGLGGWVGGEGGTGWGRGGEVRGAREGEGSA